MCIIPSACVILTLYFRRPVSALASRLPSFAYEERFREPTESYEVSTPFYLEVVIYECFLQKQSAFD